MPRKVVVYFPHCPWPPQTGAHRRCLEMLQSLQRLDYEVVLCSSNLLRETTWTRQSIEALGQRNIQVRTFRLRPSDWLFTAASVLGDRVRHGQLPIDSKAYAPAGLRSYFRRQLDAEQPDAMLMNYAYWDRLIDHQAFAGVQRLIETHDMLTLQSYYRRLLRKFFASDRLNLNSIPSTVLRERFFSELPPADCSREIAIYDRYNSTICISQAEADLVRAAAKHTAVRVIPMTQRPCMVANSYCGSALLTIGDNLYNLQAFAYFANRVLPSVRRRIPEFQLRVTGTACRRLPEVPGVVLEGFVPTLEPLFAEARFSICPVFGGTGQQVKIVEAMAHGVAVVAMESAAKASPIDHEVNGLVVADAQEFEEAVCRLWSDRALCQRLGSAARDKIAAEFSPEHLTQRLAEAFHP